MADYFITDFVLAGDGFALSDFSQRGMKATLTPIPQSANIARSINGTAFDLSMGQFQKYHLAITCTDQETPGFAAISSDGAGIWPGNLATVTLIPQLGSATALTLNMIVTAPWTETRDEWEAESTWTLELVEV